MLTVNSQTDCLPQNLDGPEATNPRPQVLAFVTPDSLDSRVVVQTLSKFCQLYGGRFDLTCIDVTSNSEIARRYEVQYTPALVLTLSGSVLYRVTGVLPERELASIIDSALRSHPVSAVDRQC